MSQIPAFCAPSAGSASTGNEPTPRTASPPDRLPSPSENGCRGFLTRKSSAPAFTTSVPAASCTAETSTSIAPSPTLSSPQMELRFPAPFSDEPPAVKALKECDYSIRISMEMAKSGTAPRAVRVYADGVYDMFHSGHARQLMQARLAFPNTYLIVGVCSDADTHRRKGSTVMNETERYEAVRHCRYVDEVIKASPWEYDMEFITAHKIDFVAHDDIPYGTADSMDMYRCFKEKGMFLVTQRTECISTTDVIGRILRDYDVYLRRNISRGLSRKELNISYVKEKQLKLEDNIQTMVRKGTHLLHNFGSKRREFVDQLEDLYQEVSQSFIRFFGSRGRLHHWWTGARAAIKNAVSPGTSSDEDKDEDSFDGRYHQERSLSTDSLDSSLNSGLEFSRPLKRARTPDCTSTSTSRKLRRQM